MFHLVDSRFGFERADADIIDMTLKALASRKDAALRPFEYVIVLTKADKGKQSRLSSTTAKVQEYVSQQAAPGGDKPKHIHVCGGEEESRVGTEGVSQCRSRGERNKK